MQLDAVQAEAEGTRVAAAVERGGRDGARDEAQALGAFRQAEALGVALGREGGDGRVAGHELGAGIVGEGVAAGGGGRGGTARKCSGVTRFSRAARWRSNKS